MAAATDQQMQTCADQRLRVRAEQARALIAALRDDKASLDSVYERAVSETPWADNRTDGPPKLLASADMLVFNTVATALLACVDGTGTAEDRAQAVATLAANWAAF